jgi:DNA polymerase-3 subunit delta'
MPDKEVVIAWLKQQNVDVSQCNVFALLALAQGSPLLALDYANDRTLTLRNDCFNAWMDIAKNRRHPAIIAEDWYKLPESALIFWISSWIIDMIKCCYEIKADWLYNPDLKEPLQELSQKLELKELYKLYDLLLISRQRLNTQINKHTMFEEILIKWFELNLSK